MAHCYKASTARLSQPQRSTFCPRPQCQADSTRSNSASSAAARRDDGGQSARTPASSSNAAPQWQEMFRPLARRRSGEDGPELPQLMQAFFEALSRSVQQPIVWPWQGAPRFDRGPRSVSATAADSQWAPTSSEASSSSTPSSAATSASSEPAQTSVSPADTGAAPLTAEAGGATTGDTAQAEAEGGRGQVSQTAGSDRRADASAAAGTVFESDSPSDIPANNAKPELEEGQVLATVHRSIHEFERDEWNACATAGGELNPFVLWEFFAALEDSRSAVQSQGWLPQHVAIRDSNSRLLALAPLYLKGHSYGEYVFDQAWANLHAQLGKEYYPKLQCCVPFTPVTGPRLLIAPDQDVAVMRRALLSTLSQVAQATKVSSVHATFNTEEEFKEDTEGAWLRRLGIQYHWENDGYSSFDDFLAALKQSKRKSIRQERKSVEKQGLVIKRLSGADIDEQTWDAFFQFYLDTVDRKWGSAYLTRDFFIQLGKSMGDKVLLVTAYDTNRDGELVAAALNFVGSDTLFGRNWGCKYGDMYKNLHFELCYYQAIEAAIERGLSRVEAGAQGQHKIQRGYLPNMTYSMHYVCDPVARMLIKQFLQREAMEMEYTVDALTEMASPFKDAPKAESLAFASVKAMSASQRSRSDGTSDA